MVRIFNSYLVKERVIPYFNQTLLFNEQTNSTFYVFHDLSLFLRADMTKKGTFYEGTSLSKGEIQIKDFRVFFL